MDLFSVTLYMERKREREDVTCDQRSCCRNFALEEDANDRNKQWKWEVFYLEKILEVWDKEIKESVLPGKQSRENGTKSNQGNVKLKEELKQLFLWDIKMWMDGKMVKDGKLTLTAFLPQTDAPKWTVPHHGCSM